MPLQVTTDQQNEPKNHSCEIILQTIKVRFATTYLSGLPVNETRVERKDRRRCSDERSVRSSSCMQSDGVSSPAEGTYSVASHRINYTKNIDEEMPSLSGSPGFFQPTSSLSSLRVKIQEIMYVVSLCEVVRQAENCEVCIYYSSTL